MKSDTKTIIESVGILGVIASLIFVGMQFVFDRRVALSEQYAYRSESIKADIRTKLESGPYMQMQTKIWENGFRPVWWSPELEINMKEQNLSGSDLMSQILQHQMQIVHWDNLQFQFNQGLLNDTFWSGSQRRIRQNLGDPLARAVYLQGARDLRPLIKRLIIELDQE